MWLELEPKVTYKGGLAEAQVLRRPELRGPLSLGCLPERAEGDHEECLEVRPKGGL